MTRKRSRAQAPLPTNFPCSAQLVARKQQEQGEEEARRLQQEQQRAISFNMMMNAAKAGRSLVLTRLLSRNRKDSKHGRGGRFFQTLINNTDAEGFTPLMMAAFNGHCKSMRVLLRNCANVNLFAQDNSSALHLASQEGFVGAVKMLLKHGVCECAWHTNAYVLKSMYANMHTYIIYVSVHVLIALIGS